VFAVLRTKLGWKITEFKQASHDCSN